MRDFQLEWPAAIGGTFIEWDKNLHAFALGEETRKFVGLVGSPTAAGTWNGISRPTISTRKRTRFRLGVTNKGKDQKLIVISGSMNGHAEAEATYRHLLEDHRAASAQESAKYYEDYLRDTVQRFAARRAIAAGVRLVARQRAARHGHESVSRHGTCRGISDFGRERAAGICVVFRARFDVDFVRAEFRSAISPTREPRSISSANSSATTEKSRTRFRRRRASSIGSRNFSMAMRRPMRRRSTSSR